MLGVVLVVTCLVGFDMTVDAGGAESLNGERCVWPLGP